MIQLTELGTKIVEALECESDLTVEDISEKIKISSKKIRSSMTKLIKDGVVKKDFYDNNYLIKFHFK